MCYWRAKPINPELRVWWYLFLVCRSGLGRWWREERRRRWWEAEEPPPRRSRCRSQRPCSNLQQTTQRQLHWFCLVFILKCRVTFEGAYHHHCRQTRQLRWWLRVEHMQCKSKFAVTLKYGKLVLTYTLHKFSKFIHSYKLLAELNFLLDVHLENMTWRATVIALTIIIAARRVSFGGNYVPNTCNVNQSVLLHFWSIHS